MSLSEENVSKIERVLRIHLKDMRAAKAAGSGVTTRDLTLSYGDLVNRSGVGIPNGQGPFLDAVAERCRQSGEPALDCLVVTQKTGLPGKKWPGGSAGWEKQVWDCFEAPTKTLDA